MKILLKIIGFFIITVISVIIVLIIVASLSQNKIFEVTQKKIGKSINAELEIEDFSFTLIKRFPYATVELTGVKISPGEKTDSKVEINSKNEILEINSVFVSIRSIPLFKGIYEIDNLEIDGTNLKYEVDSSGNSNLDFLLNYGEESEQDTSHSEKSHGLLVNFENVKIKNATLNYTNDTLQFKSKIHIPSLHVNGKFENEDLKLAMNGELNLSESSFADTYLNKMEEARLQFNIVYASDTLQIKEFQASTDGAVINTNGILGFSDQLFTNLYFKVSETELGKIIKYVPDELLNDFGIQDINGNIEMSGVINGFVTDSTMPAIELKYDFKNGHVQTKDYPVLNKIELKGEFSSLDLGKLETAETTIKKLYAETQKSSFEIAGTFSNFEKPKYNFTSKFDIEIEEFANYVPDSIAKNISGNIKGNFATDGILPDSFDDRYINQLVYNCSSDINLSDLNIETDSFQLKSISGELNYSPGKLRVNHFNFTVPMFNAQIQNTSFETEFSGDVTKTEQLKLNVHSFYTESPQGSFNGTASLENLNNPTFELNSLAILKLDEIKPFIPDSLVKYISGDLTAKIVSKGTMNLDSIQYQLNNIVFNQSIIQLEARNLHAVMPDSIQNVKNLNGNISIQNGNVSVYKLSGTSSGINFNIDSAELINVYKTLIENQKDTLSAFIDLKLGAIDYSKIAPLFITDSMQMVNQVGENTDNTDLVNDHNENETWTRNFPINLKGKIKVENLIYDKIFLDDISAKFHLTDSVYIIDQFKTKAFDGNTENSLRYVLSENNRQIIYIKSKVENMDINKLLYGFDDFGYDSLISYKNLSGIFTSDINSRFVFVNDTLATHEMRIMGQFRLKNGRLVNYQPAMDVSKFTGIKELDDIEMKTLDCNIFMFKNQLFVPITKIVSTSLDVSTFGMQSMEENYEYHLHLKLGEILKGKSQKLFERQIKSGDEVSEDDFDKNTIKIIYGYNNGEKRIGFATRKEQKLMELKIKTQQKMLELIFHPLMVSYETGVQ